MKKLSIIIPAIIFFLVLVKPVSASDQMAVRVHAGYFIPEGTAGNTYNSSWGFDAQFEYKFTESIAANISGGYIKWGFVQSTPGVTFSFLPIILGGRYYFPMPGMTPYGEINVGLYNSSYKITGGQSTTEQKLGYGLLAGAIFPFSGFDVDANFGFNSISLTQYSFTVLVIHAGLSYSF